MSTFASFVLNDLKFLPLRSKKLKYYCDNMKILNNNSINQLYEKIGPRKYSALHCTVPLQLDIPSILNNKKNKGYSHFKNKTVDQ